MATLVPMLPEAFAAFAEAANASYAEDNVNIGRWPAGDALELARAEMAQLLPQGLSTPNHFIYEIRDVSGTTSVGALWFAAVGTGSARSAYVYNILVLPAFRRCGHARRAFAALEQIACALGLQSIRLNVFAHNPAAHALYRSLGFDVMSMNMRRIVVNNGTRNASREESP